MNDTNPDESIGARIQDLRTQLQMSQADVANYVARLMGSPFHQQTILKIEKGTRSLKFLEATYIARALGVTLEELGGAQGESRELFMKSELRARMVDHAFVTAEEALLALAREFEYTWEMLERTTPEHAQGISEEDVKVAQENLKRALSLTFADFERLISVGFMSRLAKIREELAGDAETE
ncbi:helix-turn-helix transcriptional regulator [Rhodococcus sp. IEGM 1330]|uniref:helix-turn-helix transcriptional regulator n=1 Tax=Rhodococcus sp. IEGM 1330 TaxID=3082225 RepID=UPI002952AE4E|nr:helix-turn-helix transcriptional regulator [Rhodococcus sp. IEGM 1330]MDV8021997.1 helix-turn-helix transcriptional regulator [Rhodococcus sp. IEGM 1330]